MLKISFPSLYSVLHTLQEEPDETSTALHSVPEQLRRVPYVGSTAEPGPYWVDTEKPTLSSYDPGSGPSRVAECDWLVQCIGPRKSGGWVAVVRDGFALLEKDRGKGKFLGNPVQGSRKLTMNYGAVGP